MRRVVIALTAFALLATPAAAQFRSGGSGGGGKEPTPEEIEKKREAEKIDQQYRSTLQRTNRAGETPVRSDPWSNIRTNEPAPKR